MNVPAERSASRRLRIAYVVGAFPCTSETFVQAQILGIAARGHSVHVYTSRDSDRPRAKEYVHSVERIGRLHGSSYTAVGVVQILLLLLWVGWRAPRIVWNAIAELRSHGLAGSGRLLHAVLTLIGEGRPQYDVIHGQFGEFGLLALQLTRIGAMRGPVVTSFRGYDVGKYLRAHPRGYEELFRNGELFLPVSKTLASRLYEEGCDPARIRVHPSGIDCRRIEYRNTVPAGGEARLITVARLVEKKGVAYAIHAVKHLRDAGRRVSYAVIGEGPLREDLQQLIGTLGLTEHVRLLGPLPHNIALHAMRDAHILLAPSVTSRDGDVEGIPNAVKEAMAIGLPVVATLHGGMAELVDDGVSGFLVPERDAQALAERVVYLLDHAESWTAFGRAGRYKVESEFDVERRNAELEQLYYSLAPAVVGSAPATARRHSRSEGRHGFAGDQVNVSRSGLDEMPGGKRTASTPRTGSESSSTTVST